VPLSAWVRHVIHLTDHLHNTTFNFFIFCHLPVVPVIFLFLPCRSMFFSCPLPSFSVLYLSSIFFSSSCLCPFLPVLFMPSTSTFLDPRFSFIVFLVNDVHFLFNLYFLSFDSAACMYINIAHCLCNAPRLSCLNLASALLPSVTVVNFHDCLTSFSPACQVSLNLIFCLHSHGICLLSLSFYSHFLYEFLARVEECLREKEEGSCLLFLS
jgi:hypothetical protein